MMSRLTIISCLICAYVAVCNARAQGYRPSGWRPSNAELALPGEYGAPPVPTPSPTSTVQTTKENVEFAGQTVEITSQNANYAYAPVHNQFQQIKSTKVFYLPIFPIYSLSNSNYKHEFYRLAVAEWGVSTETHTTTTIPTDIEHKRNRRFPRKCKASHSRFRAV